MLRAAPSKWKFIFKSQAVNYATGWAEQLAFCWWRGKPECDTGVGEGARDIQGGLAQKVRLIKWREVTRELGLPHIPSSNTLTHARSDKKKNKILIIFKKKKKKLNRHFHLPGRTTVNQIKLLTIGLNADKEGSIEITASSWSSKESEKGGVWKSKARLFLGLAIEGRMLCTCYLLGIAGCQR